MAKTIPCTICGIEVSVFRIKPHERVCDGKGFVRRTRTVCFEIDAYGKKICPDCGKKFSKLGAQTHWRTAHRGDNPGRPLGAGRKTGRSWNRGLTKETNIRIAEAGPKVSDSLKRYRANLTQAEKDRFSEIARRKGDGKGGLRKGAGRGKAGWYEGFWCDSSWELAWVIYALDHQITFARNTIGYEYEFDGKTSKFYPDFLLESGELVEVKGYFDRRNMAKIAAVERLTVLGKDEMKAYLQYAICKYGQEFVSVAYQKPPEYRCCDCGATVTKNAPRCVKCAGLKNAKFKIHWPCDGDLVEMVSKSNRNKVAQALGVSFTAVKKRLKSRGLVAPM